MGKIIELSQEIIAKTAAGEVVERPASVVKELIENSLDAKSDKMQIYIENAGIKSITIIDNGEGMDEKDLILAIKPHTTSKIKTPEDLVGINSYGFRGEALSSVVSVSKAIVKSKVENKTGTQINLENGKIISQKPCEMPQGTSINIKDIFYNVPARKKFLRTERTEFNKILEVILAQAISHPEISFFLKHNNKVILDLPKYQTLEDRLISTLGKDLFGEFLPVDFQSEHMKIKGFVSKPQFGQKTPEQFLFINDRFVKDTKIISAIKNAYGNLITEKVNPNFVLFLEMPFENVDVNVHPRKEEVSFYNPQSVLNFVRGAVAKSLDLYDLTYTTDLLGNPLNEVSKNTFLTLKESADLWKVYEKAKDDTEILQVNNTYLITFIDKNLLIIDQHAAHEKILYEQLVEEFSLHKNEAAKTKTPIKIKLPITKFNLLEESKETLESIGFELEVAGKNAVAITAVPKMLVDHDIKSVLLDFLGDLAEENSPETLNDRNLKTISYLSCRSAIKAGDILDRKEKQRLIEKLLQTKTKYTCPHGRPAMIKVPVESMDKMFKRE